MTRREFSKKPRFAAFQRAQGRCEECTARLVPGAYQYDHVTADGLDGDPTLENCRVLCRSCHGAKTVKDVRQIAKSERQKAVHLGAKSRRGRPFPGGRDSPLKRKISGKVVRR